MQAMNAGLGPGPQRVEVSGADHRCSIGLRNIRWYKKAALSVAVSERGGRGICYVNMANRRVLSVDGEKIIRIDVSGGKHEVRYKGWRIIWARLAEHGRVLVGYMEPKYY